MQRPALVLLAMVTGLATGTTGTARIVLVVGVFIAFVILVVAITSSLAKQVSPSNPPKEVVPLANRDEIHSSLTRAVSGGAASSMFHLE